MGSFFFVLKMKKIIDKIIFIYIHYIFQGIVLSLITMSVIGFVLAFHGCGLPKNHMCGKGCVSTVLLDTVYVTDKPYIGK